MVIELPGRYIAEGDTVDDGDTDDNDSLPEWLMHDVSYVPDDPRGLAFRTQA